MPNLKILLDGFQKASGSISRTIHDAAMQAHFKIGSSAGGSKTGCAAELAAYTMTVQRDFESG